MPAIKSLAPTHRARCDHPCQKCGGTLFYIDKGKWLEGMYQWFQASESGPHCIVCGELTPFPEKNTRK